MIFQVLKPNGPPSPPFVLGGFWIGLMLLFWVTGAAAFLPRPGEVVSSLPSLWLQDGLGQQLVTSLMVNLETLGVMVLLALAVSYASVMPLFRSLSTLVSAGRFNGMVGMPIVFMSIFHNPHKVKIALLVFGVGVFTVLSVVQLIKDIPRELFDHSRTLRMSEWRVVWEVVVLGQIDHVLDILRINAAMVWMMLPMVEGQYRYEGGVGSLMDMESHHMQLDKVFCVMFVILIVGLLQDRAILMFKQILCPYADLGLERK